MDDYAMLPPGVSLPQGMKHHTLPAGEETLDFWGKFIDAVDTDSGDRPRWAELQLHEIIDTNPEHDSDCLEEENRGMFGKQLFLLYTIGHTLVYHELGSPCNKGVVTRVGDFPAKAEDPEGMEPCVKCFPPDWQTVDPDSKLELEITWYSYTPCQTEDKVIDSLSRCAVCRDKPHKGVRCYKCGCTSYRGMLTSPGYKLVQQVKEQYPGIARAAARTKRL